MKYLLKVLFSLSIILISNSFAYDTQKGKIDMHGGKGDSLTSKSAFGMAIGLGTVLNKKGSEDKKEKQEDKNFIPLQKKETIDKIDTIN